MPVPYSNLWSTVSNCYTPLSPGLPIPQIGEFACLWTHHNWILNFSKDLYAITVFTVFDQHKNWSWFLELKKVLYRDWFVNDLYAPQQLVYSILSIHNDSGLIKIHGIHHGLHTNWVVLDSYNLWGDSYSICYSAALMSWLLCTYWPTCHKYVRIITDSD